LKNTDYSKANMHLVARIVTSTYKAFCFDYTSLVNYIINCRSKTVI